MRVAFADFCNWNFHVESVDRIPMGGSQSAASYVARELARRGHQITFITSTLVPGTYDGVRCVSWSQITPSFVVSSRLEALICNINAAVGSSMRSMFGNQLKLILWNHHAPNQPDVQVLKEAKFRDFFDAMVMVSRWQLDAYVQLLGINRERASVIPNPIAPAFVDLFKDDRPILNTKAWPPILGYTSAPYRGLGLLLDAFPAICAAVPGTRLQVFSSMKVYGTGHAEDETTYGVLYRRCRGQDGVEYIGSLPQRDLAEAMKSASVLAYPNTFPETFCIAAAEALAAGCRVVSTNLAALPQTTAGFARLVPAIPQRTVYLENFVNQVVQVLKENRDQPGETEAHLRQQVAHFNTTLCTQSIGNHWEAFLHKVIAGNDR